MELFTLLFILSSILIIVLSFKFLEKYKDKNKDYFKIMNNDLFKTEDSIKLRRDNIKFIFVKTICSMDDIIYKYDYCYSRLCNFNCKIKNKKKDLEIHERAFKLTLKLLDYE